MICVTIIIYIYIHVPIVDVASYVNYKPKDSKDDYQFTDHQYSVVRHEVVREPEINGMVTIKVCI